MPTSPAANRVFFDVSDLIQYARSHDHLSGIQRVALQVIVRAIADGRFNVSFVSYDPGRAAHVEVDQSWFVPEFNAKDFRESRLRQPHAITPRSAFEHYKKRPHRALFHFLKLAIRTRMKGPPTEVRGARPVRISEGDTYVAMGQTWGRPDIQKEMGKMARNGVRVVPMVFDMIPIVQPHHMMPQVTSIFRTWLDNMYGVSNRMLAISESTAQDVRDDISRRGVRHSIEVIATPLAHELPATVPDAVRNDLANAAHRPFVLCVGTIETRKNNWGLVRVWQKLVAEIGLNAPRLIFVGRKGWLRADFDQVMAASGNVSGHVQILENVSDAELAWLYSRCLFTVYPSFYEGWGLPVGESLWFGKTCITSRNSSLPEAGGDACVYVDPYDLNELYAETRKMIEDEGHRRSFESRIDRGTLRTWDDTARDVLAALEF